MSISENIHFVSFHFIRLFVLDFVSFFLDSKELYIFLVL